jgi:hypothetical protein
MKTAALLAMAVMVVGGALASMNNACIAGALQPQADWF